MPHFTPGLTHMLDGFPVQEFEEPLAKAQTAISSSPVFMSGGLNLLQGKSLDEAYANLSNFFLKTGVVKEFNFQKISPEKYVLKVDGCMWASHIHEELKPEDVTCPYALLAMAFFEKVTGRKVKVANSNYFQTGTETVVEA